MSISLSLQLINEVCGHLTSLFEPLYGKSYYASVIVATGVGEVYVTKNGMEVLKAAGCHHPVARLIEKAIEAHYNKTGDGVKTFVFLLKEILHEIERTHSSFELGRRIELINEIALLMKKLPCIYKELRISSNKELPSLDLISNHEVFEKLCVFPSFRTKFSLTVSSHLSSLLCNYIFKCALNTDYIIDVLLFLINNFSVVSSRVINGISESCIISGIVLSKETDIILIPDVDTQFVCILESCSETEFIMKVEDEVNIRKFMNSTALFYGAFVKSLKDSNINLVLISFIANEELKSSCIDNSISLIDGIPRDELELLLNIAGIIPLTLLNSNFAIEAVHVGYTNFIRSAILGGHRYLNLSVKANANSSYFITYHHLSISGPTNTMSKQYYLECLNVLKTIYHFFIDTSSCEVSYGCCKDTHVQIQSINNKSNHSTVKTSTHFSTSLVCASKNASWEAHMCYLLSLSPFPCKTACKIITLAMQFVLRKKYCLKTFVPNICQARAMEGFLNQVDGTSGDTILESVSCKEQLLMNVLTLVVQLLRINDVVFLKNRIKSTVLPS